MQHVVIQPEERNVEGNQTYTDKDKYDNDTNGTKERCFSR